MPAFAAIFFDLIIASYNFSIKRIGHYLGHVIEPELKTKHPTPRLLWEEYMQLPQSKQVVANLGNLGITLLVSIVAAWVLLAHPSIEAISMLVVLAALLVIDCGVVLRPKTLANIQNDRRPK